MSLCVHYLVRFVENEPMGLQQLWLRLVTGLSLLDCTANTSEFIVYSLSMNCFSSGTPFAVSVSGTVKP